MDQQALLDAVCSGGAAKAAVIDQSQVVLSANFRAICESNQCGGFGQCWMCPPCIGDIEDLMAQVRAYPHAVLYQTISEIEDSYDIEGMFEAGAVHARVSQKIQARVKPLLRQPFLHLTCGGCHLCETCAKRTDEPCRHPDKALSSMEGYGIDVYQTTKDTPLKYINGQDTVTYFGIIFYTE